MKNDAGAHQEIVLVVVGAVRKMSQKVIDLDDSHREAGTHWHVDASAQARGKPIRGIADAGLSTASVSPAHQQLSKGLRFVSPVQPRLRKTVAGPGQIRCEG